MSVESILEDFKTRNPECWKDTSKRIIKKIAPNCPVEKVIAVCFSKKNKSGAVFTDSAVYIKDWSNDKYAFSYANIREVSLSNDFKRIGIATKDENTKIENGIWFSISDVFEMDRARNTVKDLFMNLAKECENTPKSELIKTMRYDWRNKYSQESQEKFNKKFEIVFSLVVISLALFGIVKCTQGYLAEQKEIKEQNERMEAFKRDTSNYTVKNLRWCETYGKSMGMGYEIRTNPILIKVNNMHVVSIDDWWVSDGTNSDVVQIWWPDNNVQQELKDLYYRGAHFNAYCEIVTGQLEILWIE